MTTRSNAMLAVDYERDGFVCPIDVLAPERAIELGDRVDALLAAAEDDQVRRAMIAGNGHLVLPALDEVVFEPTVLDAVAELLGEDLLVWSAEYITKPPHTAGHFSWHQDLTYWGLEPTDHVLTAWIALCPVTADNGCVRYVPGSHRQAILPHTQTLAVDNMLSRGQVVDATIDESTAVAAELKPGQMAIHHGRTFHASGPNGTDGPRRGMAIRYMVPSVVQTKGLDFAVLARGRDDHGNFQLLDRPRRDWEPERVEGWRQAAEARVEILYEGIPERAPAL